MTSFCCQFKGDNQGYARWTAGDVVSEVGVDYYLLHNYFRYICLVCMNGGGGCTGIGIN